MGLDQRIIEAIQVNNGFVAQMFARINSDIKKRLFEKNILKVAFLRKNGDTLTVDYLARLNG